MNTKLDRWLIAAGIALPCLLILGLAGVSAVHHWRTDPPQYDPVIVLRSHDAQYAWDSHHIGVRVNEEGRAELVITLRTSAHRGYDYDRSRPHLFRLDVATREVHEIHLPLPDRPPEQDRVVLPITALADVRLHAGLISPDGYHLDHEWRGGGLANEIFSSGRRSGRTMVLEKQGRRVRFTPPAPLHNWWRSEPVGWVVPGEA